MVSMTKTQLTIRQNINKVKIRLLHFFSTAVLVLFVFAGQKMDPRPCSLVEEGPISSNFSYLKISGGLNLKKLDFSNSSREKQASKKPISTSNATF